MSPFHESYFQEQVPRRKNGLKSGGMSAWMGMISGTHHAYTIRLTGCQTAPGGVLTGWGDSAIFMGLAGPSSRGPGQVVLSHQTGVRIPVALLIRIPSPAVPSAEDGAVRSLVAGSPIRRGWGRPGFESPWPCFP